MRRLSTSIVLGLFTLFLVSICSAQQTSITAVPNLIRYGGVFKDAQGAAVSSTTTGVTFAIYKQQDGGAPVWMETQNVTTDVGGNYSVLLGSTTATGLPSDLFSQQEQRWLGVQVQGQAEQSRVLLVSVPYAFKAHEAETLGGRSVSDFVLASGASPSAGSSNASQPESSTADQSQSTQPGFDTEAPNQGPTNFRGSTTGQIVKVTQSGTGAGITGSASTNAVFGLATGEGNVFGVQGSVSGTGGVGVLGHATSMTGVTFGVKGSSISPWGTGVRGTASAATGTTTGISAYVASPAGTAAVFNNAAGGKIISGQNNRVEKFSVDGSGNVNSAGTFRGNGSGLTGIQFSQLGGLLGSAQFSGSYSNAVTLSSTANVFYGDGSHLTGTGGGCGSGLSYHIQNGTSQPTNANLNITGTGIANGFTSWTNYRLGDSVRFKEQVRDMGDSTSDLLKLRPVTFLNKPEYDKGTRTLQYGLVAEEVAKVYPELVAHDNEGQPYTVRYQYLAPMLLNEVQKQYQRAEAEAKVITTQQGEIDAQHWQIEDLQQRLSRLESLVGTQGKVPAGTPPSAGTQ